MISLEITRESRCYILSSYYIVLYLSRTLSISNKSLGPLKVRDREILLYTYLFVSITVKHRCFFLNFQIRTLTEVLMASSVLEGNRSYEEHTHQRVIAEFLVPEVNIFRPRFIFSLIYLFHESSINTFLRQIYYPRQN